jgi:hypothetical protein
MANINFLHRIKISETISFDADYLYYKNNQPFDYRNNYFNSNNQFLLEEKFRTSKKTPIFFFVSKIDYTKKLRVNTSLDVGLKAIISQLENDIQFERLQSNTWKIDPDYTSFATLKENILAAYTAYNIIMVTRPI